MSALKAGAAAVDITPKDSQFLYGYPYVERYSTGVHDPLMSSALYLSDDRTDLLFVANDIIFVSKATVLRARRRIAEAAPIPENHIIITATHTHSGPITVDYLSNEADAAVPKADPRYVQMLEDGIVAAATQAFHGAAPAQVGLAVADATGIGTNRRDPAGPADLRVPALMIQTPDGRSNLACMLVCSMHPTVLHEDSTLVSGDFPGMARRLLQAEFVGCDCPVLHHTGPAGNQSPRHVTKANTFDEAMRLGHILGRAVGRVLPEIEYTSDVSLACVQGSLDLPQKKFPTVAEAEARFEAAAKRLEHLRAAGAPRQETRTAECDWFGAEETVTLARAATDGRLADAVRSCSPAEVQIITIGPWRFVAWPGEIFIDYALAVKARHPNTFVISLANGELQGYIVTPEAAAEGGYETSNALFAPESGRMLVDKTLELLADR